MVIGGMEKIIYYEYTVGTIYKKGHRYWFSFYDDAKI